MYTSMHHTNLDEYPVPNPDPSPYHTCILRQNHCLCDVVSDGEQAANPNSNPSPNPNSGGKYYPRCLEPGEAFKFLGKGLLADLSNSWHKLKLEKVFNEYANLIDKTLLTGIQKAWIWEHFAMAKFAWNFLISDVPPSFVKSELQPIRTRFLKKWVGLAEQADPSILYRSREQAGLGWKEVMVEHKKGQRIRRHQLATSKDPKVREIHERVAEPGI